MRSAIENWYAKVCKISEYSIRYTLKIGLTPWRRPLSAYYVGVDNSSGTEILLYIIPGVFAVLFAKFFVIFCNDAQLFHFSYQRYIENQIRATFGLTGTPVRITIRQKGDKEDL